MKEKTVCIIPKTFELGGRTWTIAYREQSTPTEGNRMGFSVYDQSAITLFRKELGITLSAESIGATYIHEVFHSILDECDYAALSNDEAFVNRVSRALYQVLVTGQGHA